MKYALFTALLCATTLIHAQITFEEIIPPEDFSLAAIRKSPTGEYFTQSISDRSTLYSSTDGETWEQHPLPITQTLGEMQFFADGTPVLTHEYSDHMIRRNGTWYTMDLSPAWGGIESSFVKGDTIFAYENDSFGFSTDKGESFATLFTFSEGIYDHRTHLWVMDQYLVLYHTVGASNFLSVFNRSGQRLLFEELNLSFVSVAYSECGKVLIYDYNSYYLFTAEGLHLQSGSMETLVSNFSSADVIFSAQGDWFLRKGNQVYGSSGCDISWTYILEAEQLSNHSEEWMNAAGDFLAYNVRNDHFIEIRLDNAEVTELPIDINYPTLTFVDESLQGNQIIATSNETYSSPSGQENWTQLMLPSYQWIDGSYTSNGDLYLSDSRSIFYSEDDGANFTEIVVPDNEPFGAVGNLHVLDNGVLFLSGGLIFNNLYTLNNGQDWIPANVDFSIDPVVIALVGTDIIFGDVSWQPQVSKINTLTGAVTTESLGDFSDLPSSHYSVREDGTIYFYKDDFFGDQMGLYRFKIGEGLTYLGGFPALDNSYLMKHSGYDLFAFLSNSYLVFNGVDFDERTYSGLPLNGSKNFWITANEHLYVLVDGHRLFRSTEPLSTPQFVKGRLYLNEAENCVPDTQENTLSHWQGKIEGESHTQVRTTSTGGDFVFSVPLGSYTLSAREVDSNWELCESSVHLEVADAETTVTQDFQAKPLAACAALELDFSTPFLRRCFDNTYTIRVRNTGPIASHDTKVTLVLDPFFDFLDASIPFLQVDDSVLEFDLGALAVNETVQFTITFNLSCEAELGQDHCLFGELEDAFSCETTRPTYTECQENIGAFDPNDKRIFNEDGVQTGVIDTNQYIYYHIRFQNTGTDTAFNVRIVDPLSPMLDVSTLQMLSASHPYEYEINDDASLVVYFNDILLPDSTTNEPASNGYFKFKIKPLPEYGYGTSISNLAGIYFDFNEPVITNEAILLIENPVGTRDLSDLVRFSIYPNPTEQWINVVLPDDGVGEIEWVEIIDAFGRQLLRQSWSGANALDVSDLPSGVYQLILRSEEQVIGVSQFVKM